MSKILNGALKVRLDLQVLQDLQDILEAQVRKESPAPRAVLAPALPDLLDLKDLPAHWA